MAQVQKYQIERATGVAGSADTGQVQLDQLLPVSDSVILGLEIDITFGMTTAGGGEVQDATEQEVFSMLESALSTIQINDSLFALWLNGSLGDLARACFLVHGRRPAVSFLGRRSAVFAPAGGVTQRVRLYLPFHLPVGREALPGSMGGRGSKSALPTCGQLKRAGATYRRVAGAFGAFSFGGLVDWTITAASLTVTVNAVCAAEQGAGARTNAPLSYAQRSATAGVLLVEAGDAYAIHARGQTAAAIAGSALEATVDGASLFESGRFNAVDNINACEQIHRYGGATVYAGDPTLGTYVPIIYPDPIDHGPVRIARQLQLTNFQGAWNLNTTSFFVCRVPAFDQPLTGISPTADTANLGATMVAPTIASLGPTRAPLSLV